MPIYEIPERIGLVGLGPSGVHHLEEISFQRDLRVVTAWDEQAENRPPHPLCPNIVPRFEDLLAREDIDSVLFADLFTARAELAARASRRGKYVILSPPCTSTKEARDLLNIACSGSPPFWVLPCRREGLDFRAARYAALQAMLGTVHSARIISWGKAIPGGSANRTRNRPPGIGPLNEVFNFFAYSYLEELLQLIPREPTSVYAKISLAPAGEPTAVAFFLSIAFRGGDAIIDVNLQASAAVQTGWMLAGTRGSYCQQKVYMTEPSGEIGETPILADSVPETGLYDRLHLPPRTGNSRCDSLGRAATIMQLIEAAKQSSRTGQMVLVEDTCDGLLAAD